MARKKNSTRQATDISAISVDLGNAYCNMQADGGISADWRSIQGKVSDNSRIADLPYDDAIMLDGDWFVFGERTLTYAERTEDFTTTERYTSKWYRRLFAFAMHRAYGLRFSEGPFYPKVIASIPAREFAVEERVEAIKRNLKGAYIIQDTQGQVLQSEILLDRLTVVPEGAGAYIKMLRDSDTGGVSIVASGLWYVLDLGYLTGDIVAFRDGDYMPEAATSNPDLGMRTVALKVAKFVRGAGGPDLDPAEIDPQLRCDSIIVNGRQYSIKDTRDKALAELGERIARFIISEASNRNLSGVLLTGGGADLLKNHISAPNLPAMLTVPNARRANCEGAYKLLTE
ncbi:MAG: hypothetical protein ACYDBJ_18045 [Aggregatilineales bacterium]